MSLALNIQNLQKTLQEFDCKLIAVSKTYPSGKILEAYQAGQRFFGENKVQEMALKYEALPKDIEWHMIGHLQSNKVKYIAPFVHLIHSVDSLKLLQEINKQAEKSNRIISCLLQIHIAEEETKFGLSAEEAEAILRSQDLERLNNIQIIGLMGMATNTENKNQITKEFKQLKTFFDKVKNQFPKKNIQIKELSMGMSSDYQIALAEGSTLVRIGSAIFGSRN